MVRRSQPARFKEKKEEKRSKWGAPTATLGGSKARRRGETEPLIAHKVLRSQDSLVFTKEKNRHEWYF